MSHRGKHLSVLHDRIPVFYSLKYPKFTADLYQIYNKFISKFFIQGGCTCALSLLLFMDKVLSEKKWRKTINEMGGNIPGGKFSGGGDF